MSVHGETVTASPQEALAIAASEAPVLMTLRARFDSHAVVVTSEPIREPIFQRGPFVMSSESEIARIEADYRAGLLGKLHD